MNTYRYWIFFLFFTVTNSLLFSGGVTEPHPTDLPEWIDAEQIEASNLMSTTISGLLTAPIQNNTNQVFCVSYNLLAQELITTFPSIQAIQGKDQVKTYVDISVSYENVLNSENRFVRAGYVNDEELTQLDKDLLVKFPDAQPFKPELGEKEGGGIFSVVYFKKELPWKIVFEGNLNVNFGIKESPVQAFGFSTFIPESEAHKEMAKQVIVHYMDDEWNPEEIVLSLHPESGTDEIVIGMVKPKGNLRETYDYVLQLIAGSDEQYCFKTNSTLKIPKINFNIKDTIPRPGWGDIIVSEKESKPGVTLSGYIIVAMSLDERGASAYSRGAVSDESIGISIIIDQPFLAAFHEKGSALPYITAWIDNDELLVPKQ